MPGWIIDTTYIDVWLNQLDGFEYDSVLAALEYLEEMGPLAKRPFVDTLHHTKVANLKELRPRGTTIRIIFAFDVERRAVTLVAGDKSGQWKKWYKKNIPLAEERFFEYLKKKGR